MIKMHQIILVVLLLFTSRINAWEIENSFEDTGGFLLRYREEPVSNLQDVVRNEDRILRSIFLGRLVKIESQSIQSDIMNYFNENNKDLLEKAIQSSGSMHSTQIHEFLRVLKSALLNTKFIKSIDAALKPIGYEIESVSIEKFFFIKEGSEVQFDALTWLTVKATNKKLNTDPGAAAPPPVN